MRLLHCADLHLGSKLDTHLTGDILIARRKELQKTFDRVVQFALDQSCDAVLLAGDLFDSAVVSPRVVKSVRDVIERHSELLFFYIHDNHDGDDLVLTADWEIPCNLKLFPEDRWGTYTLDGGKIVIAGTNRFESAGLRDFPQVGYDQTLILMLHGALRQGTSFDSPQAIPAGLLKGRRVGYAALGHYHSYTATELEPGGVCVYSGCPEGRGFDECGQKGVVLLDVGPSNSLEYRFCPLPGRQMQDLELNISDLESEEEIWEGIRELTRSIPRNSIVRVRLTGSATDRFTYSVRALGDELASVFWYGKVEDRTSLNRADEPADEGVLTLKSCFVQLVGQSNELTGEEKRAVLQMGLRALQGEDLRE
ncbi:MAG: metallophosphoesterase [Clostridia bacterium]|nr:metallophosphoesterase [Clostridia bacterium]